MNARTPSLVLALVLTAAACRSSSQQLVPLPRQDVAVTNQEVARIYFVCEDAQALQKRDIRVFDSDREIGLLDRDTFLCWERPAGRTLGRAFLEAVDPGRGRIEGIVDLDCAGGHVYYFNVTVPRDGGQPKIAGVDAAQGRALVAGREPAKR